VCLLGKEEVPSSNLGIGLIKTERVIMAKGSKQPGKKESKPVVKEDAEVTVKEEFAVSVDDGKGIINFYSFFAGLGILITIVFIIIGILRYLHIL
jgi:hypothetical protein